MIKFLVMDVDGTLTDGKVYMGNEGESFKAFDIKDGCGLKVLLPQHAIIPVIITARKSEMLKQRCKELGIEEIHQGVSAKLDCLNEILERYSQNEQTYSLANVAYIGDDILDLQCLLPIKEAGGVAGCPADAVKNVLSACDYIAPHKGGEGAVRDFVEYLISYNEQCDGEPSVDKRCMDAVDYLLKLDAEKLSLGRHDVNDQFFYNVIEYQTSNDLTAPYESHLKYIDIQILVLGEELMQVDDISHLHILEPYNEEKDRILYHASVNNSGVVFRPGSVLILYPKDAHRTVAFLSKEINVRKIVGKVSLL